MKKVKTSDKCNKKACKDSYLVGGLCLIHYLELLDKAEKQSKKSKLVFRAK